MAPRQARSCERASSAEAAGVEAAEDGSSRLKFVPLSKSSAASARAKSASDAMTIPPRLLFNRPQDEMRAIEETLGAAKWKTLSSHYSKKINACNTKVAELGQEFIIDQAARQADAFEKALKHQKAAAEAAEQARQKQQAAQSGAVSGETAASAEHAATPAETTAAAADPSLNAPADTAGGSSAAPADRDAEDALHHAASAHDAAALRAEVEAVRSRAILTVHITEKGTVTATGSAHFVADPLRMHRILELANEARVDFDRRRHEQWVADGQACALVPGSIVTQAPVGAFVSPSPSSLAALKELLQKAHARVVELCGSSLPKDIAACITWFREQGMATLLSPCVVVKSTTRPTAQRQVSLSVFFVLSSQCLSMLSCATKAHHHCLQCADFSSIEADIGMDCVSQLFMSLGMVSSVQAGSFAEMCKFCAVEQSSKSAYLLKLLERDEDVEAMIRKNVNVHNRLGIGKQMNLQLHDCAFRYAP